MSSSQDFSLVDSIFDILSVEFGNDLRYVREEKPLVPIYYYMVVGIKIKDDETFDYANYRLIQRKIENAILLYRVVAKWEGTNTWEHIAKFGVLFLEKRFP